MRPALTGFFVCVDHFSGSQGLQLWRSRCTAHRGGLIASVTSVYSVQNAEHHSSGHGSFTKTLLFWCCVVFVKDPV